MDICCLTKLLLSLTISISLMNPFCEGGRAFPVESENFIVDLFKKENPNIEWDPTNFLVDLSGHYALCRHQYDTGIIHIHRETPEGDAIGGLRETFPGPWSDAWSVNEYLQEMLPFWIIRSDFIHQITIADRFGCSVQPRCNKKIVVACLFTPKAGHRRTTPRPRPTYKPRPPPTTPAPTPLPTFAPIRGNQMALAFTPQEYSLAEAVFDLKWDRSHFLENLSGFETRCEMINNDHWSFKTSESLAAQRGIMIEGKYGSARNSGSTTDAMLEVLESWEDYIRQMVSSGRLSTSKNQNSFNLGTSSRQTVQLGCSVIPDCMERRIMYVVVSCLLQVNY